MQYNIGLISIIMPAYNVESWIEESVRSILTQTYDNFELIIIDDHSTDNTYEIIKKLASLDKRIKYLRNPVNSKICKTLNTGLEISNGKFIARFDADDVAEPNRLELQIKMLVENNLDLVGCQMISIDENGNETVTVQRPMGEYLINDTKLLSSPIAHIWLCKKEIYSTLNNYREIPYAEDYDFILRALDFGYKCDNHPATLMKIRYRAGNTSTTASLIQRKTHDYVVKLARERSKKKNDSFTPAQLIRETSFYAVTNFFHKISTKNLNKAHKTTSVTLKAIYLILSCSLSFYNTKYLIDRLKFRYKMKKHKVKL